MQVIIPGHIYITVQHNNQTNTIKSFNMPIYKKLKCAVVQAGMKEIF